MPILTEAPITTRHTPYEKIPSTVILNVCTLVCSFLCGTLYTLSVQVKHINERLLKNLHPHSSMLAKSLATTLCTHTHTHTHTSSIVCSTAINQLYRLSLTHTHARANNCSHVVKKLECVNTSAPPSTGCH